MHTAPFTTTISSTFAIVQQAIQHLTADERKNLQNWLAEYEAEEVDRWLEAAVLAGEFDAMA